MQTALEAALTYVARGWLVFPCYEVLPDGSCACGNCPSPDSEGYPGNTGKHPRVKWIKGQTRDEHKIRNWWRAWPDANIGVACGRASGLFVLDVDPGKGGNESLSQLLQSHGPLPATYVVHTGGDGWHFYFSWPSDGRVIANRTQMGPGLDIRGAGGYVIAPPSNHHSGSRYAGGTSRH